MESEVSASSSKGQRIAFIVLAFFAAVTLAEFLASAYVDYQHIGNFEGKSGYAWMNALPLSFFLSLGVLFAVFEWAKRSGPRLLAVNIVLGLIALPAFSSIASLFR